MRIEKSLTVEQFAAYAEVFADCFDHPLPDLTKAIAEGRIARVVAAHVEVAEDYEDTNSRVIVELTDGSLGMVEEWSDTSGHGSGHG